MASYEEFKRKAKKAADATVDAARQFAILSKCKMQIIAEQEKIRSLYTKLGKVYYKDYITDEEPDEAEYQPLCDSISFHYRRISKLRDLMNEVKNNSEAFKKEAQAAKKKAAAEEQKLIALASAQADEDADDDAAEEDLLEELNSLNNDTPYGEILD